ncbi:MAG: hypothetical protein ISN64_02445 [Rickettsia sp.]|nr:hypothetical protein [Rickettsia sp.]
MVNFLLLIIFISKYVLKLKFTNSNFYRIFSVFLCFCSALIFSIVILFSREGILLDSVWNLTQDLDFSDNNRLISMSLCIVHISLCIFYFISQKKFLYEFFLGNFLIFFSYIAILTVNLLTIFYMIEIIGIISSIIIFTSPNTFGRANTKSYFLNHCIANSLILFSLVFLSSHGNEMSIDNFHHYYEQNFSFKICYYFLLIGFLINIGFFPFSGYIIYSYSSASYFGYLYLFFLSNISIYIIFKLFAGLQILFYLSIFSFFYLGLKMFFIKNILQVFTNVFTMQNSFLIAFISLAVSENQDILDQNIILYMFISFCYKYLINFSIIYLLLKTKIQDIKSLLKESNFILYFTFVFALINMFNFPFLSIFYIKSNILFLIDNIYLDVFVILGNCFLILVFPWKKILLRKIFFNNIYEGFFPFIVLILIFMIFLPFISTKFSCFLDINYLKNYIEQILVILFGIIFSKFIKIKSSSNSTIFSFFDYILNNVTVFLNKFHLENHPIIAKKFFTKIFYFVEKKVFYLENHSVKTSLLIIIFVLEFSLFIFIK